MLWGPTWLLEEDNCTLMECQDILVYIRQDLLYMAVSMRSKQEVDRGEDRQGLPNPSIGIEQRIESLVQSRCDLPSISP